MKSPSAHRLRARLALVASLALVSCAGSPERAEPMNREPRARHATLDGRDVGYRISGGGDTTIVLVHGWACDSRTWWKVEPKLAEDFRVIAIDLPGHGQSAPPAEPYRMSLFARAIAAVLDAEGIATAVLVGHSNGVPTVRQFYRLYPERTERLVLVDGALRSMVPEAQVPQILAAFESPDYEGVVANFVKSLPAPDLAAEDRQRILDMATAQRQEAVVGGFRAAVDPAIWETDDPIRVPVLMLNAPQPAWSDDYVAFVRDLVPDLDYRIFPEGTGHFLMVERPDEFREAVTDFVRSENESH